MKAICIGLAVAILAGAGAWYMIRHYQLNQERQKFLTAQADLHTLAQQIAVAAGKPDQQKAVQSCRYQSEKYGRGARSCSVDEYMLYKEPSSATLYSTVGRISEDKSLNALRYKRTLTYSNNGAGYNGVRFDEYGIVAEDLSCLIAYYSVGNRLPYGFPNFSLSKVNLLVHASCWGDAKAEYFPVER